MKDKFYVGQRVRLVYRPSFGLELAPEERRYMGAHGTVTGPQCVQGDYPRYTVMMDCGKTVWPVESTMEPLYDGDQKTAWSESTWAPMHLRKFAVKEAKRKAPVEHDKAPAK